MLIAPRTAKLLSAGFPSAIEQITTSVGRPTVFLPIPRWCGEKADLLNLSGTVTLFYNGSIFVKEGIAYLLTFEHLVETGVEHDLRFRPLDPSLETKMYVIWKKFQVFTPIAELLLQQFKQNLGTTGTAE